MGSLFTALAFCTQKSEGGSFLIYLDQRQFGAEEVDRFGRCRAIRPTSPAADQKQN
jgi:hypothetical protein